MALCEICNRGLSVIPVTVHGKTYNACSDCSKAIDGIQSEDDAEFKNSEQYFVGLIKKQSIIPEIQNMILDMRQERNVRQSNKTSFQATTGYFFEGRPVLKYCGIVSSSVVLGTGFLSEFTASFSDFLGTNSKKFEDKLSQAKEEAMRQITEKCIDRGCNAVIGVDFDITLTINNMFIVSANGTAVQI